MIKGYPNQFAGGLYIREWYDLVKLSYGKVLETYPNAYESFNFLTIFAYYAGDKITFYKNLKKVYKYPVPSSWKSWQLDLEKIALHPNLYISQMADKAAKSREKYFKNKEQDKDENKIGIPTAH